MSLREYQTNVGRNEGEASEWQWWLFDTVRAWISEIEEVLPSRSVDLASECLKAAKADGTYPLRAQATVIVGPVMALALFSFTSYGSMASQRHIVEI